MQMHELEIRLDPKAPPSLREAYEAHVREHNARNESRSDGERDSGFDLLLPETIVANRTNRFAKVDHLVSVALRKASGEANANKQAPRSAFYMYPRSSLSKTRLRLANSVGIIDAGYRGNLIAAFDVLPLPDEPEADAEKWSWTRPAHEVATLALKRQRLVQVCAPDLGPLRVVLLSEDDQETERPREGERGAGGFGSTGA